MLFSRKFLIFKRRKFEKTLSNTKLQPRISSAKYDLTTRQGFSMIRPSSENINSQSSPSMKAVFRQVETNK